LSGGGGGKYLEKKQTAEETKLTGGEKCGGVRILGMRGTGRKKPVVRGWRGGVREKGNREAHPKKWMPKK